MKFLIVPLLLWAGAAIAADTAPQEVPEVVIEASKADLAHRAVTVFAKPPFHEQIARWAQPLRVHVYYAPKPAADFICQRLTEIAATVGLKVVPVQSNANVAIVFTGQSSAFTRHLLKVHGGLYRDIDRIGFPSKSELAPLLEDRPVRWFEVRREEVAAAAGDLTVSRVSRSTGYATRLEEPTTFHKDLSYVIVDADLVRGVSWQQLADYLAMVVLTEPGLDRSTAPHESILSIFSANPEKPQELTALDRAVLKGFYDYNETQRGRAQQAEIERSVAKAISQPADR
jgi:hypothetical protein